MKQYLAKGTLNPYAPHDEIFYGVIAIGDIETVQVATEVWLQEHYPDRWELNPVGDDFWQYPAKDIDEQINSNRNNVFAYIVKRVTTANPRPVGGGRAARTGERHSGKQDAVLRLRV